MTEIIETDEMGEKEKDDSALRDEQGNWSTSRMSFVLTMFFTFGVILVDIFNPSIEVPGEVYAILTSLLVGLIAWAGGRAIAQYVGPQIAGIAQGIASISIKRLERTDKGRREDDP